MKTKTITNSIFAKNLRSLMSDEGISIRALAKIAEVSPSVLSDWSNGITPRDFVAVKKIADHFNTNLTFLLTGQSDKSRTPIIAEVFDSGDMLFDGIAKITIQRLIPKNKK